MSQGQRRLAAIMFTDMVGYTALGQRNEELSLALVDEHRKVIRPILQRHGGKEVKTIGDAFLVEFDNVLEAIRCAYDIQRAVREFNISLPAENRMHLRIGVHLGDVVESDGDISGDAVNIASRIEPLAQDGQVCMTRQVYDQVQNKFELSFESLGPQTLKNVRSPVEVFKMVMPWQDERERLGRLESGRIAVLPFANVSPNPEDGYFADGMTDELISAVSKIREIRVIARTSAMKYKGSQKSIAEIGRELGVGAVLEGTVRKAGSKLRITTQLVNSQTEESLWSDTYDRELQDVFFIQSDISRRVADALRIQLNVAERDDIERSTTGSTEAYTLYLKGRYYWNERTRESIDKAVKYFEKATQLDTKYPLAFAGLADCYVILGDYNWVEPREAFPKAREYAFKAIEIDPRLAEPHVSLGAVYNSYEGLWLKSEEEFKKAIELRPSYATAHMWYGLLLIATQRFEESYKRMEQAGELDPLSRLIRVNLGSILVYMGRAREAIQRLKELLRDEPDFSAAHLTLGQAYLLDSRAEEAIYEMRKTLALAGGDPAVKADVACLFALSGEPDEANGILRELLDPVRTKWVSAIKIAQVLFALDRTEDAFNYLDRAFEEKSVFLNHGGVLVDLRTFPWFAAARKDPRWQAFLRRAGISSPKVST